MVPLWWYILLGVALFVIGAAGVLLRRNILVVLMSLELLLNSVNINFIAFGRYYADFRGQIFAIFVIAITAAEVAVALGILVALVRNKSTLKVDDVTMYRKVALGPASVGVRFKIRDVNARELAATLPLAVLVLWVGLYPKPFLGIIDVSVKHLLAHVHDKGSGP